MDDEKIISEFENFVKTFVRYRANQRTFYYTELFSSVLSILKEQNKTIKMYQKADGFLYAHGWDWAKVVNNDV